MPKKIDPELRARAVRLVTEHRDQYSSVTEASVAVASELAAAVAAASSSTWSVRAEAGRQLARRAERSDVAEALRDLLLDPDDTAVTDAVGQALLERDDVHGVRLIAQAVATADDEQLDHLGWIVAELRPQSISRRASFRGMCSELTHDEDPTTRAGAELLITWITQ